MSDKSEDFYVSLYNECEETSMMFGSIPVFFTTKKSSIIFYLFLILFSSALEYLLGTYLLAPILSFILIAEHRRIVLTRETVLEMCMIDEIHYNWEAKENSDLLDRAGMNFEFSDSDRCRYFYERVKYVDCNNTFVYLKRHYKFLLFIAALHVIFYAGLVYSVG
jgi:hypothetical protein